MKDIIIITAYTPDFERENLLRNFVHGLDTTNFDVMVVSHSRLPDDLYEKVNYFIFDRENELLTDIKDKFGAWWSNGEFKVHTTESRGFNHCLACYRLVHAGINAARDLGYVKAHVVEYDTIIEGMEYFEDNSKLLDTYSIVWHRKAPGTFPEILSYPMSYKLNEINEGWFSLDFKDKIKSSYCKTVETFEQNLVDIEEKAFGKDHMTINAKGKGQSVIEKGITTNIYASHSGGGEVWSCPVVRKNKLLYFVLNKSEEQVQINLVVDHIRSIGMPIVPGEWRVIELGLYEKISELMIIKNSKEVTTYNFDEIGRDFYKSKNYIKANGKKD